MTTLENQVEKVTAWFAQATLALAVECAATGALRPWEALKGAAFQAFNHPVSLRFKMVSPHVMGGFNLTRVEGM